MGIEPEVLFGKGEGELLLEQHYHGAHHADGLGEHGGQGRPRCVHVEHRHQQQIPENIDHAGHQHKQQRRLAVPQPAENGGEHIVGHNKEDAAPADAHVAHRKVQGLRRGLHQHGDGPGKAHQKNAQPHGDQGEHNSRPAQNRSDMFRALFAQVPGDQHGDAHGQLGHHKGDQV